jgi:SPP1 family predicted phage head-tail adaptor
MPAAGKMDRRISIQRLVQTGVSELNEPIFSYQEVRIVWGAKIHKSEDEKFASGQRYAVRVVTFQTHYMPDLTETDRLVSEGVTYDVKGIRELGRREGLEIAAEAHP